MSLIDEALKRARLDAARQDEAQRRAAVPWVPTVAPARRRRAWVPAALAGTVVAVLGIGLGLIIFREEAPAPAPAPERRAAVEAPTAAPPTTAPAQPVLVEEEPEPPEPAVEAPPARTAPAPVPEAAAPPPAAAEPRPAVPQPPPRRVQPAPAPPAAVPPTPSAAPAADPHAPTYLRDVDLPGGKRLSLTGIAYSAQPIAVINGVAVGPGEIVEGYTVEKIEPDRVELASDAGPLVLLLRQGQ